MPRLVVVSNRVTLPGSAQTRAGGLAVAMREALQANGGLWFGWSGDVVEQPAEPRTILRGKITYAVTDLTPAEHELYYAGYSNAVLWPLLHFRLGLIEYKRNAARAYFEVNRRFAALLAPMIEPDDLIWVQDYHLIPLGSALRARGIGNRIGFFLHTPFPPPEVVMALPRHENLIEAMCAYDLLGFQTDENCRAFLRCVTEIGGGSEYGGAGGFVAFGRIGRAATFPIGIDTEGFAELARRSGALPEMQRLEDSLGQRRLILGVDRLDYSKGIPQRFEAIEGLLSDWPEHRGKFTYLQITPHSRGEVGQYRALRRQIDALAGRINGQFAEFDWSPIRYVNRSFTRATLAGFNRRASIGLVTPLRDGMNLVAKEFVAAQDGEDPGVLILSRFAGAAKELDAALLVNPIDSDEISTALHRGLSMSLAERQQRWQNMIDVLRRNTIQTWTANFLAALTAMPPSGEAQRSLATF